MGLKAPESISEKALTPMALLRLGWQGMLGPGASPSYYL